MNDQAPRWSWSNIATASTFVAAHFVCFAAIWTGVTWRDLFICAALYVVRMFAVTAGYHRYFAHRSYKMGRLMQFVMAFAAQTAAQKGVIWWAGHHRHHHKQSDTDLDVHTPRHGFFWSHIGWILSLNHHQTKTPLVSDLDRFPELRFLDRFHLIPTVLLAAGVFFAAGWSGLVVGYFVSTILVWHGTFAINSLAHLVGRRRYDTGDDSRNSFFLALLTLGEGWHNNHHHYRSCARQGFFWWEVDITYYLLRGLSALKIVSDLKEPPAKLVAQTIRAKRCAEETQLKPLTNAAR